MYPKLVLFLGKDDLNFPGEAPDASDRSDRDQLSSSSIIYPQVSSQVISYLPI